jgi:ionotropic kainate glutamate receptor 2
MAQSSEVNYVHLEWASNKCFALFSGAIFTEEQRDSSAELAFKYAVYRINKDKHILPRTNLVYDIQYVPRDDSFHASKKGRKPKTVTLVDIYMF